MRTRKPSPKPQKADPPPRVTGPRAKSAPPKRQAAYVPSETKLKTTPAAKPSTSPTKREPKPTSKRAAPARSRGARSRTPSTVAIAAEARLLQVGPGLHNLTIAASRVVASAFAGIALPAVFVTVPGLGTGDAIELIGARGQGVWLDAAGGTVMLRATTGGHVLLTSYNGPDWPASPLDIELRPADAATMIPTAPNGAALRAEIVLHIEREGDRQFTTGGWAGRLGSRRRVEALAVRPLEAISHGEVEYKVYSTGGRETPWVSDGRLCGTRGQGLPLTGFAIRLAPHLRNGFDVIYRGAFFASGPAPTARNGEACFASLRDDPLEAVEIRIVERGGAG